MLEGVWGGRIYVLFSIGYFIFGVAFLTLLTLNYLEIREINKKLDRRGDGTCKHRCIEEAGRGYGR